MRDPELLVPFPNYTTFLSIFRPCHTQSPLPPRPSEETVGPGKGGLWESVLRSAEEAAGRVRLELAISFLPSTT